MGVVARGTCPAKIAGSMRARGAFLLLTGSLTACGGHILGADAGSVGSHDGSLDSSTDVTSVKIDSGFIDSATESGTALSCEPAFVEAGTGLAGDVEIPVYHRAAPSCCPSERGPADPFTPPGSWCSTDAECSSGPDGRCFGYIGSQGPGVCSYDQCFTDSDCTSGTPCLCRSSPSDNSPNVCAAAGNCVLDSDCGPGGYCSASHNCGQDYGYGAPSYYCHTASDTCINDADCASVDAGVMPLPPCQASSICAYTPQARGWACTQQVCCPP
jgi:hypothetical protein